MNKKINLYAVYGSLKRNFGNYRLLNNEHSQFLGTTKTKKIFSLYSLGGFPGLKNNGKTEVEIEVFKVTNENIESRIDMLEGYFGKNNPDNMYNKQLVDTKFGKAYIYIYNGRIPEERLIKEGIWK